MDSMKDRKLPPDKGNFIEEQERRRRAGVRETELTGQQGEPGSAERDQQPNWTSKQDAQTLADQPPVARTGNQPGGGGSRRPSR